MVVEGEPGIFPDPIARILRAVGRIFRRDPAPIDPPAPTGGGDDPEA